MTASSAAANLDSIPFTGKLLDPVAQMSLMRKRWHDPNLGRWITRDPVGYVDGMSLYLYTRGNPLAYFDPWGLFCRKVEYRNARYEVDENGTVWLIEDKYQTGWFGVGDYEPSSETRRTQKPLLTKNDVRPDGTLHPDKDSGGAITKAEEVERARKEMLNAAGSQLSEEAGNAVTGAAVDPVAGKVAGKAAQELGGEAADAASEAGPRIIKKKLAGPKHPQTGVPFDANGFPDFSAHSKSSVKVAQTGNRAADATAANKAAGLDRTPDGYTWHHHQDGNTMQLVRTDIHQQTGHTGGVAIQRN